MPPIAETRVIRESEYRSVPWANGAGRTREIHASAEGGQAWAWRLSIASISADAPFSCFPGIDRHQVLLVGNGLRLHVEGEDAPLELAPPHGQAAFAGEAAIRGEPVDGAVDVFNLMWRRDAVAARLWHRPLVGSMYVFAEPGTTWAVYLLAGRVDIEGGRHVIRLAQGDTALLVADAGSVRYMLDGGGEVLLARIAPHPS